MTTSTKVTTMILKDFITKYSNPAFRMLDQRNELDRLNKEHLNGALTEPQKVFFSAQLKLNLIDVEKLVDGYSRIAAIQQGTLKADVDNTIVTVITHVTDKEEDLSKWYDSFNSVESSKTASDCQVTAQNVTKFAPLSLPLKKQTIDAVKLAAYTCHKTNKKDFRACFKVLKDTLELLDTNLHKNKVKTKNINSAIKFATLVTLENNPLNIKDIVNIYLALNDDYDVSQTAYAKLLQSLERLQINKVQGAQRKQETLKIFNTFFPKV